MIGYVNAHSPHRSGSPPLDGRARARSSSSTQLHAVNVRSLYVSDLAIVRTAPHTLVTPFTRSLPGPTAH